jgi:hypothetical protein
MAIYLSQASTKDVQATGEAFSPQKRTSITSKDEFYQLFSIFALLDPDTDPGTPLNPDPILIRILNTANNPMSQPLSSRT